MKVHLSGVNAYPGGHSQGPREFSFFLKSKNFLQIENFPQEADLKVCIDHQWRLMDSVRKQPNRSDTILVRLEPKVVLPSNYLDKVLRTYSAVVSVGGDPEQSPNPIKWPQVWPDEPYWKIPTSLRSPRLITVSSNKFSFVKNQLYTLRREAIQKISALDVAGRDWEEPFPSTILRAARQLIFCILNYQLIDFAGFRSLVVRTDKFIGSPENKIAQMSRYQYSLVIENESSYMSEKLFDAFFAGCIPIYVGPNISKYDIPRELVIQAEPNLRSIEGAITQAQKLNHQDWRQRLDIFLESEKTKSEWAHDSVYMKLLSLVESLSAHGSKNK